LACEADAQQALSAFGHDLQATQGDPYPSVNDPPHPLGLRSGDGRAGLPDPVVYQIEGVLASAVATHEARVVQHSGVILATHELDESALSPRELLEGYEGQKHVERGFRSLNEQLLLPSSLCWKKPQRIMALLMVMTVCPLVYAALELRIRKALEAQQMTFPYQKGQSIQNPTARWGVQYFIGIHLLLMPRQWLLVPNLTETHAHLLRRLGQPYEALYA
jgi:hypothetical protein